MVGKMWLPSTIPGYGFVPVFRINDRRITPAVGVEADLFAKDAKSIIEVVTVVLTIYTNSLY